MSTDVTEEIAKAASEKATPKGRAETNRLADFPPAAPDQRTIAHNGLSDEERATAGRLGYDLRDVRFIAGRMGAELTMLGVRQRTVVLDANQLRAVLAELAQYAKADSGIGSSGEAVSVGGDISSYFSGLGSTATATVLTERTVAPPGDTTPAAPREAPKVTTPAVAVKKRGRPPGVKDSKKRAPRGSLVSKETQEALDAAIKAL